MFKKHKGYSKSLKVAFIFVSFSIAQLFAQNIDNHVKALFVYNFSRYLEWPESMKKGDFIIGVYNGTDELVEEFIKSCEIKKVGLQHVVVRNITSAEEAQICHVIFVPTVSSKYIEVLSNALKSKPVLIVSETIGVVKHRSGINLFHDSKDGGTKFELNKKMVEAKGIRIENSLEALAAAVY